MCKCVSPCCLLLCRHTHELKLHQLLVRVCGWEQIKPVSVDKVGVFFRYAAADRNNSSNTVRQNDLVSTNSLVSVIHKFYIMSQLFWELQLVFNFIL